jgi:hypothetical protein
MVGVVAAAAADAHGEAADALATAPLEAPTTFRDRSERQAIAPSATHRTARQKRLIQVIFSQTPFEVVAFHHHPPAALEKLVQCGTL